MRHICRWIVIFLTVALLTACLPSESPTSIPTETREPATHTPTPTEIWFPPTPTFTVFPTNTSAPVLTPTVTIEPQYGALLFEDDFSDPNMGRMIFGAGDGIALGKNELTIAIQEPRGYRYSQRQATELTDFYAEITASPSICRSEDEYGMLIRLSPSFDFYRFSLTCSGQTRVDKYYKGTASSPQPLIYSSEVPPGAPSTSRLAVWVSGKVLHFYLNQVYQFSIRDPSISAGTIGVFARASGDDPVTVNYSDLKVFQVTK